MRTWLLTISFLFAVSGALLAQALTTEQYKALGVERMPKAQARKLFFQNRIAPPNGVLPPGARIDAFNKAMNALQGRSLRKGAGAETMKWTNVGPFNIGGRIKAVAINPLNPNTMFVGAAGGGIWRSYDEGLHWHSVSDLLPTQAMGSIVINPQDTNIVYAGTGEASFGGHSFDGAGIFKSMDGGTTWNRIGAGMIPDYARVSMMAINPINPNIIYASVADGARNAADLGIWRSIDAGATWTHVFATTTTDIVINPINPNILYTVGTKIFGTSTAPIYGMHKTTDGGDTWTKLDIGVTDSLMGRTSLALCATHPDVVYAAVSEVTSDRTPLLGIFKTTDGGATWAKKAVPFDYLIPQGWFDNVIAVDPSNPDIAFAGGVKCVRTGDGGTNWERVKDQLGGGLLHVDQHGMAFNPQNPDRFFIGNDGGLFLVTNQGKTLEKRDIGMSITQFIGGDFHPTDSRFLFGGTQDNGTMRSPDASGFELVLYGDGGYGYVHPTKPNIVWTTQETGKLFRSEDHGQTWYRVLGDMPPDGSLFYTPYDMDKNRPETLFMGTYRVYRTTNEGRNWKRLQSGLFESPTGGFYYITALDIADYNSNLIMAGAPLGMVAVSTDAGDTWTQVGDALDDGYVASVRSFAANELFAVLSTYGLNKVYKSNNLGQNWTNITGDLPDIPAKDIWKLDNALFLATDLGVFVSEDGGAHWLLMTNGIATMPAERFYYNEKLKILRVYTHGRGLFDLQWKQPADKQPVFVSAPPSAQLEIGQSFTYAPVVEAWPLPVYSLTNAPAGAGIDPVLGTVHWKGGAKVGQFTVKAENSAGSAMQDFVVATNDAPFIEWQIVSADEMSTGVNVMRYAGNSTLWVGRDSGWVSRSTDGGANWVHYKAMSTDVSIIGLWAFDENNAIIGTGGPQSLVNTGEGHLLKTTDGGMTWREMLYGIDSRFGNIHFWNNTEGIVVSQGAKDSADVWITADAGETWQKQIERAYAPIPFYNTLRFVDRNTGFYAAYGNDDYSRVEKTTDGGATWKGVRIIARFVSELAMVSDRRGYMVDEFTGEYLRTVNGNTWSDSNTPMTGMRNCSIDFDPSGRYMWVVNDSTAWTTNNLGTTWTKTTMVPSGAIRDAVFADSTRGWAITRKGVVQQLMRNPLVSVESTAAPLEMHLGESYPNPVTAGTRVVIPFTLSHTAAVTLKIYNSNGKAVETLVEQTLPPGTHYTAWGTTGLASGAYFYTLQAGAQSATGRIAVIQ